MKLALIAVGLLATISQVPSAFARAAGLHGEDPWNPQHVGGLPAEVRTALARMCGGSRAHQFASYFQAGCLHQVYVSTGGRYRLLRTYYAPEGD